MYQGENPSPLGEDFSLINLCDAKLSKNITQHLRGIGKENEVEIIKGHVSKDHVHLFVSVPPHLAISKLVQYLKGKSSYKLLQENKSLSREFWGRQALVGQGIFCGDIREHN